MKDIKIVQMFSSHLSNVQVFGQIFDQIALLLMERDSDGWIIFLGLLLVDSLGPTMLGL